MNRLRDSVRWTVIGLGVMMAVIMIALAASGTVDRDKRDELVRYYREAQPVTMLYLDAVELKYGKKMRRAVDKIIYEDTRTLLKERTIELGKELP